MTKEEEEEENRRTTPLGLFNFAESYFKAAKGLHGLKLKATHRDSPIYFLYYHAIELYLKAFLRHYGLSVVTLSGKKFGHQTGRLRDAAVRLGLFLMDEDEEVIALMASTDIVIRSRYLRTGAFTWPTLPALNRTCKSLRETIGGELKKAGIKVRGIP